MSTSTLTDLRSDLTTYQTDSRTCQTTNSTSRCRSCPYLDRFDRNPTSRSNRTKNFCRSTWWNSRSLSRYPSCWSRWKNLIQRTANSYCSAMSTQNSDSVAIRFEIVTAAIPIRSSSPRSASYQCWSSQDFVKVSASVECAAQFALNRHSAPHACSEQPDLSPSRASGGESHQQRGQRKEVWSRATK